MRSLSALVTAAVVSAVVFAGAGPAQASGADPTLPGCTGGVAANPSVDQTTTGSKGGPPTGYTFVPASPQARLLTDSTYASDGSLYAYIATPDGKVSEAYEDIKPAIPGGVYDLSVWAGTHDTSQDNKVGLRFLNAAGTKIGNDYTKDVTHDVDVDRKLGRENLYGVVAPPGTATVRFFASTNYSWVKWDCVYLRVSAYTVQKEVQDPATGAWLDADADAASPGSNDPKPAAIAAGGTANYRITVKNTGSEPLTGIKVADPWCTSGLDIAAFSLAGGASKQLTCVHSGVTGADDGHVNTATASGVKYWNGTLPNKTETAAIKVTAPPAQNKLGDFVWADNNRDGVQDATEPGVPGVAVTLKDDKNATLRTTTTGPDGKYLFDALADGSYQVCFTLTGLTGTYAGYLPTRIDAGGDDSKDSDAAAGTGCTPVTALGPNKRADLSLDAGIRPPNRLGDYVWIDDNKDGLQTAGEPPVTGVTVILKDGNGTELTRTTTGADGKYLFGGLKDGTYQVCFDLNALPAAASDYQATTPDSGDDATDSDADPGTGCTPTTMLNVDKPEDLTLDLGLTKPVNWIGDLVWVDADKDGQQDAGEPGVPDVAVTLKNDAGAVAGTTTTGPDGTYLFDNLADGTYQVCFDLTKLPATYADYTPTTANTGNDGTDSDADPASGCTQKVTLGTGARQNLTLDAGIKAPQNRLGDYLWVDADRDGQQGPAELPVAGVTVTLKNDKGVAAGTTTTGPDGKYLFDDLPDGSYQVCFDRGTLPASYADYQFTTPRSGAAATDSDADPANGCTPNTTLGVGHREDLTLDAGIVAAVNRLGDFVWKDGNRNGLQDTGEPGVPGVAVTLRNSAGAEVAKTTTGADGKYLFDNLANGTYRVCFGTTALPDAVKDNTLTAANAGEDAKDSDADLATGCTPEVTLGVGKRENLTLDAGLVAPPNKIGDLVWFDRNGNGLQDSGEPGEPGVPNAPVTLKDDKGAVAGTTTTGPDGKYLFDNVPDGTYRVCFGLTTVPGEYAGYLPTRPDQGDDAKDSDADLATGCTPPVTVGVGKRENRTLDLGLVKPTNRIGDLLWYDKNSNGLQESGEPGVPGVTVKLRDGNGAEVTRTTTDSAGKYLFDGLADGTYQVCFEVAYLKGDYAGAKLTKANAGDEAADSDADPKTGCTQTTVLGPNRRVDLTLDAGLLPVPTAAAAPAGLPSTGASVIGILALGGLLLAGGCGAMIVARRRRTAKPTR